MCLLRELHVTCADGSKASNVQASPSPLSVKYVIQIATRSLTHRKARAFAPFRCSQGFRVRLSTVNERGSKRKRHKMRESTCSALKHRGRGAWALSRLI